MSLRRNLAAAVLLWGMWTPFAAAAEDPPAGPSITGTLAFTSDYVYRGISLRDEKPTPFAMLDVTYGRFYFNGVLIGIDLGTDALGRSIGSAELDATVGATATLANVEFNAGVKYTGYPNGRDLIPGTLTNAERDFVEPFVGATVDVGGKGTIGAMLFWTPDFYNETGSVTSVEGKAALFLPPLGPVQSKLVATVGGVHSAQADVVSPGNGYLYYNAGIEGRLERLLFALKYWGTDVRDVDIFDRRLVLSVGVELN